MINLITQFEQFPIVLYHRCIKLTFHCIIVVHKIAVVQGKMIKLLLLYFFMQMQIVY